MSHQNSWLVLALAGMSLLAGCAKQADQPPTAAVTTKTEPAGFTDEQLQNFALLPENERLAAETQAVCPVSEHGLGTLGMGMPYKITLKDADGKDQTIYLCCKGCEGQAMKDPVGTLAKLKTLTK